MVSHSLEAFERLQAIHGFPKKRPKKDVLVKGWRTWGPQFQELLDGRENPILLEIGCWFGKNIIERLTEFPNLRGIAVDTFEGGPEHQVGQVAHEPELEYLYEQFLTNTWDLRDRLAVIRAFSWDGMQIVADFGLQPDVVYIDAGHTFDMISRDVETACRLFKKSIICGDDYDALKPNAVKEFLDAFTYVNDISMKRFERFWYFSEPIGETKDVRRVFAPLHLRRNTGKKNNWSKTPDRTIQIFTHASSISRSLEIPTYFKFQGSDKEETLTPVTKNFTKKFTAPSVYTGVIENALVSPRAHMHPRYWLVFGESHYVADSANDVAMENWIEEKEIICTSNILTPSRVKPETFFIKGKSVWFYNFRNLHHFMEETLPALVTLKEMRVPLDEVTYICAHLSDDQMQLLQCLGISASNILQVDRKWIRCEKLYWPCFSTLGHISSPSLYRKITVDMVRSAALKFCSKTSDSPSPKKLFVSRDKAQNRRLINEDTLVNLLRDRGFVDVDPGNYSIVEQIQLFSEAEIVVGVHGMGVTNFIFSRKPKILVEIMSSNWSRPYYFRQCQETNIPYAAYFIEPVDPEATAGLGSYIYCDVPEFLRFLEQVSEATGIAI